MIRISCVLHLLLSLPGVANAAASIAPASVGCSRTFESTGARPDLGDVRIFLKKDLLKSVGRLRFTPEWIGSALRRSLRKAHPLAPEKPRFVSFLTDPGEIQPVARVEYDWFPDQNGIQIVHVSEYRRTRDSGLYRHVEHDVSLRHLPIPASVFDFALQVAFDAGIGIDDLASALEHPMGPPMENRSYVNQQWVIGRGVGVELVSVAFEPADATGLTRIKAVLPVSTERKRSYFSQYGCTVEHDQEPLEIATGRYRFKKIAFGPGLIAKIENQHCTTRAEVIEAFEKSRGGVPSDALYRGQKDRRWFVSKLDSGDFVKVTYVVDRGGDVTILTAFHVDGPKWTCYLRLVAMVHP